MDWSTVDPLLEIDGAIHRLEDDRCACQHRLEEAVQVLWRFEAGADTARAVVDECRAHISYDTQEIAALREDRRAIVPDQRPAQ